MSALKRMWGRLNPLVRGLVLIALFSLVIVLLSLEQSIFSLMLLARIAFFLAIAFFVFLVWRERRADIATWSRRSQTVLYASAALIVAALAVYFWQGASGPDALALLLVIAAAAYSMFRVWRDERTYS